MLLEHVAEVSDRLMLMHPEYESERLDCGGRHCGAEISRCAGFTFVYQISRPVPSAGSLLFTSPMYSSSPVSRRGASPESSIANAAYLSTWIVSIRAMSSKNHAHDVNMLSAASSIASSSAPRSSRAPSLRRVIAVATKASA